MAAPVGPVGVLCIQRVLRSNWRAGFVTGLGTAFADGTFAYLASLGLASATGVLTAYQTGFRAVGGFVLLVIGTVIFRASPPVTGEVVVEKPLRNFLSGLVITLTNPMTIVAFAAVYVGLGLGATTTGDPGRVGAFVVGVFLGSCLWWLILSGMTAMLRERVAATGMAWVNRICGGVILVFGAASLISLLWLPKT